VRLNCGGDACSHQDGKRWAGDGFHRGGRHTPVPAILGPDANPSHETARRFTEDDLYASYHVPLPKGRYSVLVHCFSLRLTEDPRCEMLLEGDRSTIVSDTIKTSTGVLLRQRATCSVADGILDMEFANRRGAVNVLGIEIRCLD
jgi:hypothetical protein